MSHRARKPHAVKGAAWAEPCSSTAPVTRAVSRVHLPHAVKLAAWVTPCSSTAPVSRVHLPHAVKADVSAGADDGCSPTTSIQKVAATLATGLLLSLVLAARAVVHA